MEIHSKIRLFFRFLDGRNAEGVSAHSLVEQGWCRVVLLELEHLAELVSVLYIDLNFNACQGHLHPSERHCCYQRPEIDNSSK